MKQKSGEELNVSDYLTKVMESSYGERLGRSIIKRQCDVNDIDFDRLDRRQLRILSKGVYDAIKLFGDEKAETVRQKIEDAEKLLPDASKEEWRRKSDLADAISEMGRLNDAMELYGSAIEDFDGTRDEKAEIYGKMGYIYQRTEDYEKCEELYNKALKETTDRGAKARFIDGISSALWRQGEHEKALETAQEAFEHIDKMPEHALALQREKQIRKAAIYRGIGNIQLDLSNKQKAIEYCKKAIDIYEKLGMKGPAGSVYNNMARVYEDYENFSTAINYYEKGVDLCKESGHMFMQGWSSFNLASALCEVGRADEALERCHDAQKIMEAFDHSLGRSRVKCMEGKAYKVKGYYDRADECFQESLQFIKDSKAPDYEEITLLEYARMLHEYNRTGKAVDMLQRAIEIHGDKQETITSSRVKKYLEELK